MFDKYFSKVWDEPEKVKNGKFIESELFKMTSITVILLFWMMKIINPETGVFSIVNVKSQLEKFNAKKDEIIANLDVLVTS